MGLPVPCSPSNLPTTQPEEAPFKGHTWSCCSLPWNLSMSPDLAERYLNLTLARLFPASSFSAPPLCLYSSHTNYFWFCRSAFRSQSLCWEGLFHTMTLSYLALTIRHCNFKCHLPWEDFLSLPTPWHLIEKQLPPPWGACMHPITSHAGCITPYCTSWVYSSGPLKGSNNDLCLWTPAQNIRTAESGYLIICLEN